MASPRILITGGSGLVGSLLTKRLRVKYGNNNVIASDVRRDSQTPVAEPYAQCDISDFNALEKVIRDNKINWIINQSAILSAACETNPQLALKVNVGGFQNLVELARQHNIRFFSASTIASFGLSTPRKMVPDVTIQRPPGLYGSTKVHNELVGEFYNRKLGVDFRCLRYPVVITEDGEERGRSVDFAVQIFAQAVKSGRYTCDVAESSCLPYMLVEDVVEATIKFMEADESQLTHRTYNVTSFDASIGEIAKAIRKYVPEYKVDYKPCPIKQPLIDGMPDSLDDSAARKDWGWKPLYNFENAVPELINRLKKKYNK